MTRDPFDDLAARARDDGPEPLDVSATVLARVAELPTPGVLPEPGPVLRLMEALAHRGLDPSLAAAAGLSLTAAAATLVVALPWLDALFDPLMSWVQPQDVSQP